MYIKLNRPLFAWIPVLAIFALALVDASASEGAAAPENLTETEEKRGRILFLQCRACHAVSSEDNGGKIGPSLYGIFGQAAASAKGYESYSNALKEMGPVWNTQTMNQWLANPSAMVPGTSMVFSGISDDKDRALLVRYLEVLTQPPTE